MNDLNTAGPAFLEMAHQIVWCSAATVDRSGRPRSRVLPAALVGVSAAILLVGVHAGPAAGQLEPGRLHALADLEAEHEQEIHDDETVRA